MHDDRATPPISSCDGGEGEKEADLEAGFRAAGLEAFDLG